MKVIFAQGNPSSEYAGTRHNVGFMAVDALAIQQGVGFLPKSKFHADIAEFESIDERILLVKPTTFYNETGQSARSLIDFYKLSPKDDLLVVHDDLALPFGTIRIRRKGSDAGNNGIKSLNAHIGQDYTRLRVGIGVEGRTNDDSSYVLGRFSGDEMKELQETIIPKLEELIHDFVRDALEDTSHKL